MNSVERVHAAMRCQVPDRVPVVEFLIHDKVARALFPDCVDAVDCMDRLGLDGVCCGAQFLKVRENADGSYMDEWGVSYLSNPEAVAHPLSGPLKTRENVEAYVPPDPAAPHRLGKLPDVVKRYKGKRAIFFHHRAAFMWSAYLTGIDQLLLDLLDDPAKVELLMDKVLACNMAVVRRAIRAGAEIVVLGDDYAGNQGPMMSPALFRKFLLPRLKKMVNMIHAEGAFCVKHSDGNLYPLLEMIVGAGPDGLNPIEPVAGMELGKVKRLTGGKLCLIGNIDCGHLLSHGTVAEVRQAVCEAINVGAPGGGYILSSSNSIHSSCKPENVLAMFQAAQEFGGNAYRP